jgi:hypothetical protein
MLIISHPLILLPPNTNHISDVFRVPGACFSIIWRGCCEPGQSAGLPHQKMTPLSCVGSSALGGVNRHFTPLLIDD